MRLQRPGRWFQRGSSRQGRALEGTRDDGRRVVGAVRALLVLLLVGSGWFSEKHRVFALQL